jgi:hypothetical protein
MSGRALMPQAEALFRQLCALHRHQQDAALPQTQRAGRSLPAELTTLPREGNWHDLDHLLSFARQPRSISAPAPPP